MTQKSWAPTDGWAGAGEYRGLGESCPRCGSKDIKWGVGVRTSMEVSTPGQCRSCGLAFRTVAQSEMIDEGCYDTESITVVEQSDIND